MLIGPGARLGPYEIVSVLGTGGMGQVWRARDPKLGRDVAIKVLPSSLAAEPERLARFQREAQVLASLNHPSIAAIYHIEEVDGVPALVMELVEGETLADRIARGPIPLDEALPIAKQIAEALEAAHEQGIIHRDLKPSNIKVTPDGVVKVLDFGLAKLNESNTSNVPNGPNALSMSPTITSPAMMTGVGLLLGTAAYMAPEQAKGRPADKRSDIWAFGCVLYEMLTGRRAFGGSDVSDTLAAVLRGEPDWGALPADTPTPVRGMLRRCLQKDRTLRLQAVGDARIEIHDALVAPAAAEPTVQRIAGWRRAAVLSVAALGFLVLGIVATWYLRPSPNAQAPANLVVALPVGDRLDTGNVNIAISPDGTRLAYVATRGGVRQLYLRALESPDAKPIQGTEGSFNPFFSPDGQWIGFFAQGKLKKVSLGSGAPLTVCDAGPSGGASWGADDSIVFAPSSTSGLWRVSAAGGEPQMLTNPDPTKGEYSHRYPQILPGGKAVLFTALNGFGWDETRVEVLRLDTRERRVLIQGGHTGRYVSSGHLIYYRAGALLAVPFDPTRLQVTSTAPVSIAEDVRQSGGTTGAAYSSSAGGTLAYIPAAGGSRQFEQRLVWVDRQGRIEPLPAPPRAYAGAALSPDGRQVGVYITSGVEELWIYDLLRGALSRLTSGQGSSRNPVWTPDGTRVAYRSNRGGPWNMYWRPSDGSGSEERLLTSDSNQTPRSWSSDGQLLAFDELNATTGYDIWVLRLRDRKAQPFLRTPFTEDAPHFSPDGRWLAYVSDESGGAEVYVQPYPGPGGKWRISTDGGGTPQWNPNGRELFYVSGDKTMVVDIATVPTFRAGKPRLLYQGPSGDPSPDGQRFLAVQPVEPEQPPTQIHVMLNWFEELKRLVPTR
jgi:eukaryotic-like serine/threonine-protein kinase